MEAKQDAAPAQIDSPGPLINLGKRINCSLSLAYDEPSGVDLADAGPRCGPGVADPGFDILLQHGMPLKWIEP